MSIPLQVFLTVAPLACYFYVVGIFQSGHRPRVVAGSYDFALLAFGVSGLVTVGPVGQILMSFIFGIPTLMGWGLWLLFLGLLTMIFSGWAAKRLIVYNLNPDQLQTSVAAALAKMNDNTFSPTLNGFESSAARISLTLESSNFFRVGTIEIRGNSPEAFAHRLRDVLREEVRELPVRPSRVTWGLFILSWLTMLLPLCIFVLTEPKARAAFRAFLMKVTGGG